jgi:DNA-binding IclR family transcriptional regulator
MAAPALTFQRTEPPEGTQAIVRAMRVLRLLARWGTRGCRLKDLVKASDIPHPTLRRILLCLMAEGFVVHDAETRCYLLGPVNYELGLATFRRNDFHGKMRPKLEWLARQTGDTVYLNIRSGSDQVCIDRVEGYSPIRALTQEIGGRRPLGFGSSGLAILASLEDHEVEAILVANARDIANHPRLTAESLRRAVARVRHDGYAVIHDTTVAGVSAIGIVVETPPYIPATGVGLAMVNERLTKSRARELYKLLKQALCDS